MKLIIQKSDIDGSITAPPSKSYTHRALTMAGLSKKTEINNPLLSEDTKATIRAIEAFGAGVEAGNNTLIIRGFEGTPEVPDNVIDVANSGTTLRFMTAIASLAKGATVLTGDDSIRTRPNTPLLNALNDLGAEAFSTRNNGMAPIVVRGRIRGGKVYIDGSISSQFISALLIACPLADIPTSILIKGTLKSRPYVDITLSMLKSAGIKITTEKGSSFTIPSNQDYNAKSFNIHGDFSSASYIIALGALCGDVVIKDLYPSEQGDSAIIDILAKMGADISWNQRKGEVKVSKSRLKGIRIDAGKTPDLVPILAVLGAVAEGVTIIENAGHVRFKETDRLHAITVELRKMGVDIREEKERLIIRGGEIKGAEVHGWNDHRIVMALTVAGVVAGRTSIDTVEAVEVSYPNFFNDLKKLGGIVYKPEQSYP